MSQVMERVDQTFDGVVNRLRLEAARKVDAVLVQGTQMQPIFRVDEGGGVPMIEFQTGGLIPRLDDRELRIQDHAHRQFAAKAGIPWLYYQKMIEQCPDLWRDSLSRWWEVEGDKGRLVRAFAGEEDLSDGVVRAFLSDRFRVLDNLPFVERVLEEGAKAGALIHSANVDEEKVFLKLLTPMTIATQRGDLIQGGLIVRNSEVGSGKICIQPFSLYLDCTNGMIGTKNFSRVHLGGELDHGILTGDTIRKMNEAVWGEVTDYSRAAFLEVGQDLQGFVDRLDQAEKVEVGEPRLAVANIVDGNAMTGGEGRSILDQFLRDSGQNGETQFGMVQAVTRVAQEAPSYGRQVELERVGSKMLEMTKTSFERLVGGNLGEKKVEKILGSMN